MSTGGGKPPSIGAHMRAKGYSRNFVAANRAADKHHIGVRLGRICIERDIPVKDVASYLGISRQILYQWFLGKNSPSPKNRVIVDRLLDQLEKRDAP